MNKKKILLMSVGITIILYLGFLFADSFEISILTWLLAILNAPGFIFSSFAFPPTFCLETCSSSKISNYLQMPSLFIVNTLFYFVIIYIILKIKNKEVSSSGN